MDKHHATSFKAFWRGTKREIAGDVWKLERKTCFWARHSNLCSYAFKVKTETYVGRFIRSLSEPKPIKNKDEHWLYQIGQDSLLKPEDWNMLVFNCLRTVSC